MLPQKSDCVVDVSAVEQDTLNKNVSTGFARSSRCSSQASSLYSTAMDICRICHCEGSADCPLITPCYCSGSLRYVHQGCLQQWIKSSNIRCCELCKFQFIMQTKTKPFNEWEYLEMTGLERKKLVCAMLFHIIAMTCVCWSLYVLIDRTLDEVQRGHLDWPFWTKLIVVAIGFMGGIVFMYIQCKAYVILCQRWKAYNRVIYVQNAPEKPTPPCVQTMVVDEINQTEGPSCSIKPYSDACSSTIPERGCIDIKGVRNLHIFFNEENRIRFHKPDVPTDCSISGVYGAQNIGNNLSTQQELDRFVANNGASWHIEIGNNRSIETVDNRQAEAPSTSDAGEKAYKNGVLCTNEKLPSFVKLQIEKAEIVIEFGENSKNDADSASSRIVELDQSEIPSLNNDDKSEEIGVLNGNDYSDIDGAKVKLLKSHSSTDLRNTRIEGNEQSLKDWNSNDNLLNIPDHHNVS